jgi:hypothetical protein
LLKRESIMKRQLCLTYALLTFFGCDPQVVMPSGSGGSGGSAGSTGSGGSAGTPSGTGGSGGNPSCGAQTFQLMAAPPPNMLLVLDKSGSMGDIIPTDNQTKWHDLKQAIATLVQQDQQIRFGLMTFPSDNSCGSGGVQIGVGAGNGNAINTALGGINPGGSTPTAASLAAAGLYQGLHDTTRADFVLLATDGLPNCNAGDGPTLLAVQTLMGLGIKTFVIGLGADTQANPQLLNDMAMAGGTARATNPKYFQANNAADLQAAIAQIAGSVVSCTYRLDRAPPDTNQLYVTFDNTIINNDPQNGWTYDPTGPSLVFHGTACDELRNGMVMSVHVQYGCPPVQ